MSTCTSRNLQGQSPNFPARHESSGMLISSIPSSLSHGFQWLWGVLSLESAVPGSPNTSGTHVFGSNSGRADDVPIAVQHIDSFFQLRVPHQDNVADVGTG